MDTLTITIGVSILIYIVVGGYAGRGIKKLDDYFVAGRRAPTLLILGTLVASVMSTAIFMGEAAFTYDGQFGAYLLFPGIAVTGYMLGALFFGVYLRRSRAPTVADYFGRRFHSRRLQQFAGFTIILGLGGYLLIVTQGAAILLSDITDLSFLASLIVAWFSYTLFTMYSGSKGVIITDTLMFLLFMTATVVFVVYIVDGFGGISTAVTDLARLESKAGIASWTGIVGEGTEWPTPLDYVIWAVVVDIAWAFVYAVGPWQASRHLMARDEHVVLRAAILACLCVIVLQMLIYGIGGLMNLANPDITPSETVLIWAAQTLVPEMLGALLLAGISGCRLVVGVNISFIGRVQHRQRYGQQATGTYCEFNPQNHADNQFGRPRLLLLFSAQHFLVHAVHRNSFRVKLGTGWPDEYLEQTHHERRSLLGNVLRLLHECDTGNH